MRLAFSVLLGVIFAQYAVAQVQWPQVVDRTSPAVVVIETEKGQGSGFFVRPDGTILTNAHVLNGANKLAIRAKSGEVYRGGFVLVSDPSRDLAILRVEAFDVPTATLGNSNEVQIGTPVLLLGAPRGLEQSASDDIVAAVRTESGTRLIQTSAAASPGSSGGPLLNAAGEVVGVLSFTITQSQNLNFAIPINYARGMLDRLATVVSQPERRMESLPAAPLLADVPTTTAREPGGIYVTGFGPQEHLQQVYLELTEVLAANSIRVVELHEIPTQGKLVSISGLVAAAKNAKADGLLYFTLSTGWNQTDRLNVQCFDGDGKLLWKEETTSRWQFSIEAAVNAVTKRMKERLETRARKLQFPGQPKTKG